MTPSWFMHERRKSPTIEDSYALLFANLEQMAAQIEENKELIRDQNYSTKKLQEDLEAAVADIKDHEIVAKQVIEDHKFANRLKIFLLSIFGVIAAVVAFLHQTTEMFDRFKG